MNINIENQDIIDTFFVKVSDIEVGEWFQWLGDIFIKTRTVGEDNHKGFCIALKLTGTKGQLTAISNNVGVQQIVSQNINLQVKGV